MKCFFQLFCRSVVTCILLMPHTNDMLTAQITTLRTQADVDEFDSSITVFNGNLSIGISGPSSNITDLSNLSNLEVVNGDLYIDANKFLTNLSGLDNLTTVTGSLSISNNQALLNFDGLQALTTVGENFECRNHDNVTSISALNTISSVGGRLQFTNMNGVSNLDGFQSLKEVGETLQISFNQNLKNVAGLTSLSLIGQDLDIKYNTKLQDINGLRSLRIIGRSLKIEHNYTLHNVNGLRNLVSVDGSFRLLDNLELSDCCGVKKLLSNPDAISHSIAVSRNLEGCLSEEQIQEKEDCSTVRTDITGTVFFDANQNKIQEETEYGIDGIQIINSLTEDRSLTNVQGLFGLEGKIDQQYALSIDLEDKWDLSTDQNTYEFTYNPNNKPSISFGVYSPDPTHSGKIDIVSAPSRCNTDVRFFVSAVNDGFVASTGEVQIRLDPLLTFVSGSGSVEFIVENDLLIYPFDTLFPFEKIDLTFLVQMPSEQSTGESLSSSAVLIYKDVSGPDIQNTDQYTSIVLCSYDPNDKQVSPVGVKDENYTLIEDELSYTVRFQNTGNAAAIDLRILDTLDESLDLQTFKVNQSSFPVYTTLQDRALEFYFENIWLIDSLTNEPESHGFINYSIKPKADIEELTEIENTAHIIFDFNPAIITNTTRNTMVETICDDLFITEVGTICEGEEYRGFTTSGNYDLVLPIGITCDSFVTLELTVLPEDDPFCMVNTTMEQQQNMTTIYPNPLQTGSSFTLANLPKGEYQIAVFDITGQKAFTSSISTTSNTVQVNLREGLYFLSIPSLNVTKKLYIHE